MQIRKAVIGLCLLVPIFFAVGAGLWYFKGREWSSYRKAVQAFKSQNWSEAKLQYGWYLAQQPDKIDALTRYAEASEKILPNRAINVRDAARAWNRIAALRATDEAAAQHAAEFCADHELWLDLQSCAQQFAERFPDNLQFASWRAMAEENLGNADLALSQYEILAQSPACPPRALSAWAVLVAQQGRGDEARARWDAAIAREPDNALLHAYRCDFLIQSNQLAAADNDLKDAMRLGQQSPEVLLAAARLHAARREWNDAAELAKSSIKLKPDVEAYLLYCQATMDRGADGDKHAASLLKTADPLFLADHPRLYFLLYEIQIDSNQLNEAKATADAYRLAHPDHAGALEYFSARQLEAEGDLDQAIAKLRTVVQGAPDLRVAVYRLVKVCLDTEKVKYREVARDALEGHMRTFPSDEQAIALWRIAFAKLPVDTLLDIAAATLRDESAPVDTMVTIAGELRQEGGRSPRKEACLSQAQALLDKAAEHGKFVPGAILARVECSLANNNIDQAEAAVSRARASDADPAELGMADARIALARADIAGAQTILAQETKRAGLTDTDSIRWARVFADNEQLETGLTILRDTIASHDNPDSVNDSAIEQVALAIREQDYSRALELINSFEPGVSESPESIRLLTRQKLSVAQAFAFGEKDRNRARAEEIVVDVRAKHPDDEWAALLLAKLKLTEEPPDVDGAEEICAHLRSSGVANAQLYELSTDIATMSGRDALAYGFASKAADLAPYDSGALLISGRALLEQNRFGEAAARLAKALRLDSRNSDIPGLLARALAGTGRFAEFDAIMKRLERDQPAGDGQDVELRLLSGWRAICGNDWATAEQICRALYEGGHSNAEALRYLVTALANEGKITEAENLVGSADDTAVDGRVLCELAVQYLVSVRPPNVLKATTYFTKALSIRPNYPLALIGLIQIESQTGNAGRSLSLCNRFLQTSPDDAAILLRKAQILASMPDRVNESFEILNAIISKSSNPDALHFRGSLSLAKGQFGDALRDFQDSARLAGNASAQLNLQFAEAYIGLKELRVAALYAERAKQKAAKGEPIDQRKLAELGAQLGGAGK